MKGDGTRPASASEGSSPWLTQTENLHRLLMEAPAAIAIIHGRELRYVLSNPLNQALAGGRQLVGRTIREAMPELEAEGLVAMVERVLETGEPLVARELPVRLAGMADRPERMAYLSGTYQPLRGPTGEVEGIMSFAFEVTDQVHARRAAEQAEARLRLAVDAAGMGTWDFYPQTGELACNRRYRQLFGLPDSGPLAVKQFADAIAPDDMVRVQAAVQRAFDPAGDGEYRIEYRVVGVTDGIERFVEMRGRAFFDERGTPIRFTGTGIDMSAQKRAADRLRFLSEAAATLTSSLDVRANLDAMARQAVPLVADWCVVDLVDEEGSLQEAALAHGDPVKQAVGHQMRKLYAPAPPGRRSGLGEVLRSGQTLFLPELSDDYLRQACQDERHYQMVKQLGLRSAVVAAFKVDGRSVGTVSFVLADSRRRYEAEDVSMAEDLASRASLAMENARLFREVERAVEKRDDFLSIASHELKTPLTSLGLFLDACRRELERGKAPDLERMRTRLDRASGQLDRVTSLVNRLLDVSRISAGRLELDVAEADLGALITDAVGRLRDQASKVGCELRLAIQAGADELRLRCDASRLDEVVTNLLANALKFGVGRPVDVQVGVGGDGLELRVSDHGPGVRAEDRERIFERFERTAEARNIGGIGLGLWISKQIVVAHGGSIRLDGEALHGATFIVQLPRDVPPAASHPGGG